MSLVEGAYRAVVAEAKTPVPAPGEILVRVEASGVNRADLHQIAGQYPPPAGSPRSSASNCPARPWSPGSASAPSWPEAGTPMATVSVTLLVAPRTLTGSVVASVTPRTADEGPDTSTVPGSALTRVTSISILARTSGVSRRRFSAYQ